MSLTTWDKPHWKPRKGTAALERRAKGRERVAREDAEKAAAKRRDGRCRFPWCPYCAANKYFLLQAAHVLNAKGIGGDPDGVRSTRDQLMTLCPPLHERQEHHDVIVEPLTEYGTDGPCAFWLVESVYDAHTGERTTRRHLWAQERSLGAPDTNRPRCSFDVLRAIERRD